MPFSGFHTPSQYTESILYYLDKYNLKATFYRFNEKRNDDDIDNLMENYVYSSELDIYPIVWENILM